MSDLNMEKKSVYFPAIQTVYRFPQYFQSQFTRVHSYLFTHKDTLWSSVGKGEVPIFYVSPQSSILEFSL